MNFFLICDWNFVPAWRLTNWYCSVTLQNRKDDCCKSVRSSRVWAKSVRASSSKEWWYHKGCPFSPLFLDSTVLKVHVCFSIRLVYVKVWGELKAVSLHLLYGATWENYKSVSSSTDFRTLHMSHKLKSVLSCCLSFQLWWLMTDKGLFSIIALISFIIPCMNFGIDVQTNASFFFFQKILFMHRQKLVLSECNLLYMHNYSFSQQ